MNLTGSFHQLFYSADGSPIRSALFGNANTSKVTEVTNVFENCKNLETVDISKWDTSHIQYFNRMFSGCHKLTEINLAGWKTDNLSYMAYMFNECFNLKKVDFTGFDTSNVISFASLFESCTSLETIDFSGFTTTSLEYVDNMFNNCSSLKSLDLSMFETSNVKSIPRFVYGCSSLKSLDLSSWVIINKDVNMMETFFGANMLESLKVTNKFRFNDNNSLRGIYSGTSETTNYWVMDDYQAIYEDTEALIKGHNDLQDSEVHTYSIKGKHEISFDTQGGDDVPQTQMIFDGKLATDPQYKGKKTGYRFMGWTLNDQPFTFNASPIDGPLRLKASWQAHRYSVKYHSTGGTGSMNDQVFYFDELKALQPNTFTKTGYHFTGWNTKLDGKGESYTDQQIVSNLSTEDAAIVDLYAQWKVTDYVVSFENTGDSKIADKSYTIEKGIDSFETPTRTGYDFDGWYEGDQKVESIPTGQIGDRTLTAKWLPKSYKITFEDENLPSQTYTIESRLTLPIPSKKRIGYHFIGWEVKDVLSKALNPTIITEIQPGRTGDLLLKANWQANSYVIHYDANGGTGTMNPQLLTYNQTVKLAKNTFTKEREQFVGWNTKKDGSGTAYSNEQEILNLTAENNGSVTLFAQWKSTTSALEDLINQEKAKNRDKNRYTTESWSNYEKALKEAEEVLATTDDPDKHQTALVNLQNAIANLALVTPQIANKPTAQTVSAKRYPTAKRYPLTGLINDPSFIVVGIASVSIALAGWSSRRDKKTKR